MSGSEIVATTGKDDLSVKTNVSTEYSFAEWTNWDHFNSTVLQSRGLDNSRPENVRILRLPAVAHSKRQLLGCRIETILLQSCRHQNLERPKQRSCYLHSTTKQRLPVLRRCFLELQELRNVQQVKALKTGFHAGAITTGAFAVILAGGSVITWGASTAGGDSSAVQCQLGHVCQIQATSQAFAAVLKDGSVVTWGNDGQWVFWWWQLHSARSATKSAADSRQWFCLRRDPGRWICSDMGHWKLRW